MSKRPVIYISAVEKEFRSARLRLAETLESIGCEVKWREASATPESAALSSSQRNVIGKSAGVIQLVGKCFGAEPASVPCLMSLTQQEALHAVKCGRRVWLFHAAAGFVADEHEAELEEFGELQHAYVERTATLGKNCGTFSTLDELKASVLKLRREFTRRRRNWATPLYIILLAALTASGVVVWRRFDRRELHIAKHTQPDAAPPAPNEQPPKPGPVAPPAKPREELQLALARLADTEMHARQPDETLTPLQSRRRAFAILEKELALPAGTLDAELPGYAFALYGKAETAAPVRAHAAYSLGKYEEAEKLFLDCVPKEDAPAENPGEQIPEEKIKLHLDALDGAAASAAALSQFRRAVKHYEQAAELTSRERQFAKWARVRHKLATMLAAMDEHEDAARLLATVVEARASALSAEHADTLASRSSLALELQQLGKFPEAEAGHRAVLEIRARTLGPEHPDTLATRSRIALLLHALGRLDEAAAEQREIIAARTRTIGAEHPDTLASRNQLAYVLRSQGKLDEAEAEHRAILEIRARTLGPEHPATLATRNSLALLLVDRRRFADAEKEHRALLETNLRTQGPEHPDTLMSRANLAIALRALGRLDEAEKELRTVLETTERLRGPRHPETVAARKSLAMLLAAARKFPEAEPEIRAVLAGEEETLGREHPETLLSAAALAGILNDSGRPADAEAGYRALLPVMERILGADHPDTVGARNNLAVALQRQEKFADAEKEQRTVLESLGRVRGPDHADTLMAGFNLAITLEAQGRTDDARPLAARALAGLEKTLGPEHPVTRGCRKFLDALPQQ